MSESEEVLAVKFCFHCGRLLSDEVARLGDEVVDIDDFLEAINLTLSEDEVPYFCFNCNILYIVNFDERYCKWIDTNEKKSGSKHMQKDYKKCLHGKGGQNLGPQKEVSGENLQGLPPTSRTGGDKPEMRKGGKRAWGYFEG